MPPPAPPHRRSQSGGDLHLHAARVSSRDTGVSDVIGKKLNSFLRMLKKRVPAKGATNPQPLSEFPKTKGAPLFADAAKMKEQLKQQMIKPAYDVGNFYHKEGRAQAIARHQAFEIITLLVISLNALWISIDSDLNGAATLLDAHIVFQVAENFFCAYFFMEWLTRYLAFKRKCNGLRDAWFVFDSCLVLLMVLETWVMTAIMLITGSSGSGGLGNASILRMARLLRLTRMARMARLLRAMPELMILIKGMLAAMRSVIFTLLLLLVIIYVFAILFKQLTQETWIGNKYFESVPFSMMTLLHRATFMDDFHLLATDVVDHSPGMLPVLYMFVLVSSLTLMNMLIGVLVEVVQHVASTEKEAMTMSYVKEKIMFIMSHSGVENEGLISRAEFMILLTDPVALGTFLEVDVDPLNLVDAVDFIFQSEEVDEFGEPTDKKLSCSELMDIVLALRGSNTATVRDMVDLRKFIHKEMKHVKDLTREARGSVASASPQLSIRACADDSSLPFDETLHHAGMTNGPTNPHLAPTDPDLTIQNGGTCLERRVEDSEISKSPASRILDSSSPLSVNDETQEFEAVPDATDIVNRLPLFASHDQSTSIQRCLDTVKKLDSGAVLPTFPALPLAPAVIVQLTPRIGREMSRELSQKMPYEDLLVLPSPRGHTAFTPRGHTASNATHKAGTGASNNVFQLRLGAAHAAEECDRLNAFTEVLLRKFLNELQGHHLNSLAELRSENSRLVDELTFLCHGSMSFDV